MHVHNNDVYTVNKVVCVPLYIDVNCTRAYVKHVYSTVVDYAGIIFSIIQGIVILQGRRNRSGCSGFGQTSFSQGKSKIPFLQKASNKQSTSVILGLIRLIILSYNR